MKTSVGLTKQLASNIINTTYDKIPQNVREHGIRSMYNWLGVAIGAAYHESVDMALSVASAIESAGQAQILGRNERADLLQATFINGMSSHIFDFDDTHLDTIHHPSGPVAPVVFALAEFNGCSEKDMIRAFVLGVETELRIANAVCPSHYDLGWHITSSAGVFGSAVAAGILLDLDEEQMVYALGIAGTQAFGLREMFGTMTKPFHPGKAAQNGLFAAMLAKRGFTSSVQVLEAKRGFAAVTAPNYDLNEVNFKWGENWETLKNAFKPYACGIVLHPAIDACIALRQYAKPEEVEAIQITVNPYVAELTSKPSPTTGLEGKFSIFHTCSAAFIDGDACETQYSDDRVNSQDLLSFRPKIKTIVDENMSEEKAYAVLYTNDGRKFDVKIDHATGSIENPMKDEALKKKFMNLVTPVLGEDKTQKLTENFYKFTEVSFKNEILPYCAGTK